MANRGRGILTQVLAHPADSFAAHDVVGIDHHFNSGNRGDMAAHNNHRAWGQLANQPAHLPHFFEVDDDR